ncbi:MAG: hypothetical protein RL375_2117 [Pseudomonadota bacterium]
MNGIPTSSTGLIAVDWGTSSLRVYRLAGDGRIVEQRSVSIGLRDCQGRFEALLAEHLAGWTEGLIVMAGMVGSRNGWFEVPYVECPAGPDDIGRGMREVAAPTLPGRRIVIAPGACDRTVGRAPEVMRGEETQILGLLDTLDRDHGTGPHTLCLPGTHSKWATVCAGRLTGFRTAMTGEVFAVLRQHSLLGAGMVDPAEGRDTTGNNGHPDHTRAFELGLATSREPGGLLNNLFSVRSRGLFGELTPHQAAPYLSGLLIGHELGGLLDHAGPASGQPVHLIGQASLCARYRQALTWWGVPSCLHDEALVTRGLVLLAQGLPS